MLIWFHDFFENWGRNLKFSVCVHPLSLVQFPSDRPTFRPGGSPAEMLGTNRGYISAIPFETAVYPCH